MTRTTLRLGAIATTSWLAIGIALSGGGGALAQTGANDATVADVVVTGTRASLQSAINRKRRAATNVDSLVAEDIAQFPDKSVGEALQRVTGVQLSRGGEGDATAVSIRGVEPDLNRVEINGIGVLNNDSSGGGSRTGNLAEIASELIASIDVVKGFTADMTEGSVGGTVSITTRKPLDLRRPLLSVSASGQHLTNLGETSFRGNITAGRTWFDNRFGLLANVTYDEGTVRGDALRNTDWGFATTSFNTAAQTLAGNVQPFAIGQMNASGDFDNSPDKTYVDPLYANVTSKAGCPVVPTGPLVTAAEVTTAAGTANSGTAVGTPGAVRCLSQWSDYVPGNTRYGLNIRYNKRISAQLTAQFRINDNLTTFVDYRLSDNGAQYIDYNFQTAKAVNSAGVETLNAYQYDRNGNVIVQNRPGLFNPDRAGGVVDHHLVDYYTAPFATTTAANANVQGAATTGGSAGAFGTSMRDFSFAVRQADLSGGFNWQSDSLKIDGLFARSRATNRADTNSIAYSTALPSQHVVLSETGVPTATNPAGFDPADIETYLIAPNNGFGSYANTGGAPRTALVQYAQGSPVTFQYRPSENDSGEDLAKIDLDWFVDTPFVTKIEVGVQQIRRTMTQFTGGGGGIQSGGSQFVSQYDPGNPPLMTQGGNINYNLNVSPVTPNLNTAAVFTPSGTATYNQQISYAEARELLAATISTTPGTFFSGSGYDLGGITIPANWATPDWQKFLAYNATLPDGDINKIDLSLFNRNNVRSGPCLIYVNAAGQPIANLTDAGAAVAGGTWVPTGETCPNAPTYDLVEVNRAAYGQVSFEGELLGMRLQGNAGVRVISYRTTGQNVSEERETIVNPLTGTGNVTRVLTREIRQLDKTTREALPTLNLQLDITDKLLARFGYAKVLARPRATDLVRNVVCTYDRTPAGANDGIDDICTSGNLALEPYRADQYDLSLEYYRDRDTLLSAAAFYKDINSYIIGATNQFGVDLFNDGRSFIANMPTNGQGAKVKGFELSAQTAFTFLPAPFDGLGGFANFTHQTAENTGIFNALTGEELPFTGLSENSYNVAIYYDKGPINARLAYNYRDPYLKAAAERSGNPRFQDATAYVDAKMTYRFSDHLSAFVEGKNLTGEIERSSSGGIRMSELQWAGKRYFVGVTYKY